MILLALLLVHSARSCSFLDAAVNVEHMAPWSFEYDAGHVATIYCFDNFFVSSAISETDNSAVVRCGPSGEWLTFGLGFETIVTGCIECIDSIASCNYGSCVDGVCICYEGYEKSLRDPRLCAITQCDDLVLANQKADPVGPYDVDAVVAVKCNSGHHVLGTKDGTEQVLTCKSDGHFGSVLRPCVVCGHSGDCTNGTCNANHECECDIGFIQSSKDKSVCIKIK
ncbi:uncharacterized protein LOC134820957 [Bolinopsis microptera]|uniref:uncharacterized protein LOC134820957 n=1 Tax=Bolinopsis microptera TaxID=2820187 RepID=UPI003079206C